MNISNESLPEEFWVKFQELKNNNDIYSQVRVSIDDIQVGDIINDNSYEDDGYRFHDVFHYTFATLLDWSPCVRSMLKLKRKSNSEIDRVEDGARAAITEESISLLIFNEAKKNNFYQDNKSVNPTVLEMIKLMTSNFEVREKTIAEWEAAILTAYKVFRALKQNNGGKVYFNSKSRIVEYKGLN